MSGRTPNFIKIASYFYKELNIYILLFESIKSNEDSFPIVLSDQCS